jgi:hypothetical protein
MTSHSSLSLTYIEDCEIYGTMDGETDDLTIHLKIDMQTPLCEEYIVCIMCYRIKATRLYQIIIPFLQSNAAHPLFYPSRR